MHIGHNLATLLMMCFIGCFYYVTASLDTGSSGVSRRMKKTDRNRRSWTDREEAVLIASLRELIAQGFKSDNGFRAGYLTKLEEALKKEFPSTDLKGNPHINSKLCAWKKNYYSLTGILSRSGVGFNVRGTHTIDIEDDQWEQIVKVILLNLSSPNSWLFLI